MSLDDLVPLELKPRIVDQVRPPAPQPGGGANDPIDHLTFEGMRGSQGMAALFAQGYQAQKQFLAYVLAQRNDASPQEQAFLDPLIKQMVLSLNSGVMDHAERLASEIMKTVQAPDPPTIPEPIKKRGLLRRLWEDF